MANPLTAQQMVQIVRDELAHFNQTPYWDGFGLPPSQPGAPAGTAPPTSILFYLNLARRKLGGQGVQICSYTAQLEIGTPEYTLNIDNAEIHDVTVANVPLTRVTLLWLDANFPGWQNYPPGDPNNPGSIAQLGRPQYYYTIGSVIGFQPAPDLAYNAAIRGEGTPADMAQPSDTPWELPVRFHQLPCYMAALEIGNMDIENDNAQRRVAYLNTEVQTMRTQLQAVIWERSFDSQDNINVMEYRNWSRRGADA